jgi:hypothetical protein
MLAFFVAEVLALPPQASRTGKTEKREKAVSI